MSIIAPALTEPEARTAAPPPEPEWVLSVEACTLDDGEFARLFHHGALFGTPAMYVALVVVAWVAVPAHLGAMMLAAVLPAVLSGWYFGGIVALTVLERRRERVRHPTVIDLAAPTPAAPAALPS